MRSAAMIRKNDDVDITQFNSSAGRNNNIISRSIVTSPGVGSRIIRHEFLQFTISELAISVNMNESPAKDMQI